MSGETRILVADDSPTIVDMLRQVLEGAGYSVLTAPDGLAAMNIALREVPDLIISDLEMPEMTGLQLCRLLKGDPRTRQVPFVILSTHKEQYEQYWGREAGADDYLPKPFGPPELLARVSSLLTRFPRQQRPAAPADVPAATRVEALEKVNASLERRLFELTVVHGISAISSISDGERETVRRVLDRLSRLLDFSAGALVFAGEGTSYLMIRRGIHPQALQQFHAELISTLPAPPTEPPRPGLLGGAEFVSARAAAEAPAVAIQPLAVSGRPVGLLAVARDQGRPFEDPERELLALVAGQAALVLENTRLVEAERAQAAALAQQNDELRRLNRTITDMIGTVTHDLRTPLTSVLGYLELVLEEGEVPESARSFLEIVQRNTHRMLGMINDLLDVSRMEARRVSLEMHPTSLLDVQDSVITTLRPAIEGKQQKYICEIAPEFPAVMADARRLHQALENLLSNASKYTPRGGTIRLSAALEGDRVRVAVTDTGIGLSDEDLRQVFSKFFRAKRPEMVETTGTGLGLAIVKNIIDLHGGEVFVESKMNEGSTFGFTLQAAVE